VYPCIFYKNTTLKLGQTLKKRKMNKVLYEWLKSEWKLSNHVKYQKYFEEWVKNLTDDQISGFEKMRTADNIKH
jgi:hypothetical protein